MGNIKNINLNSVGYGVEGVVDDTLSVSEMAADSKAVGDALSAINSDLFEYTTLPWFTEGSDPTGWVKGYFLGRVGEAFTSNTTSKYYMRTHYVINAERYPLLSYAKKIKITPPAGYSVRVRVLDVSDVVIATYGQINTDNYPEHAGKTIEVSHTSGNRYILDMGRFNDQSSPDKCADSTFVESIVLQFGTPVSNKTEKRLEAVQSQLDIMLENTIVSVTWESGTINASTGLDGGTNTTRIRTSNYYLIPVGSLTVNAPSGYKYGIRVYSDPNTYVQSESYVGVGWYTGENTFIVQPGRYVRFVAAYSDDSTINTNAGANVSITHKAVKNDIVARNDPTNMLVKLQQLNRPTRTGSRTLALPPLCFIHFSDIHGDSKCLQNVIDFKNHYSDYIADILHTGDTVETYATDGMNFWDNVDGAEKILNVIGNHDTRVGSTWISQTMSDSYQMYLAPYIQNWGVTYESGKTYYYKDYADNKVRLIVLDIMHQTADQLTWFANVLSSARTNSLHVIVAVHSRPHWQFDSYDNAWDDKINVSSYSSGYSDESTQYSSYPGNLSNDYANAVDTFMDQGGHFICWLHGHVHFKMFAKLATHTRQLDVAVSNAGGTDYAWTNVWARIPDTKSEDDFNVIAVDTYAKILRIAKVGVNYDRYMRYTDVISYDYENSELIYCN